MAVRGVDIVAFGIPRPGKEPGDGQEPFLFAVSIHNGLSLLAKKDANAFVPGIDDLIFGNAAEGLESMAVKMARGRQAVADLVAYGAADKDGDEQAKEAALSRFRDNEAFLGYAYFDDPKEIVPPVKTSYYAFHFMVYAGGLLPVFFLVMTVAAFRDGLVERRPCCASVSPPFLSPIWPRSWVGSSPSWAVSPGPSRICCR